jgi:hypothetical protein
MQLHVGVPTAQHLLKTVTFLCEADSEVAGK